MSGMLATAVYDIAKLLVMRHPKKRLKDPKGVPSSYKLVIHTDDGMLGINLDSDMQDIEIPLSDIPDLSMDVSTSRAYQKWQTLVCILAKHKHIKKYIY